VISGTRLVALGIITVVLNVAFWLALAYGLVKVVQFAVG
jgi:hypothetical protein